MNLIESFGDIRDEEPVGFRILLALVVCALVLSTGIGVLATLIAGYFNNELPKPFGFWPLLQTLKTHLALFVGVTISGLAMCVGYIRWMSVRNRT